MNKVIKDKESDCWLWRANKDKLGYGKFTPLGCKNGLAHRSSHRIFKGPIKENMLVLHSCHVTSCVNPAHLRLGTHADNMRDKVMANRCKTGRANSKLTESDVREIRSSELTQSQLSKKYNMHIESIGHVIRHKTWKHI